MLRYSRSKIQSSNIMLTYLKEIGFLTHFLTRKSAKIGEIENMFHKRHLAIFYVSYVFSVFLEQLCTM